SFSQHVVLSEKQFLSGFRQKIPSFCLLLLGFLLTRPCMAGLLPPVITVPPLSQSAHVGDSVTFLVVAVSDTTMNYQWRKSGVNIIGATGSSYMIGSVQASD